MAKILTEEIIPKLKEKVTPTIETGEAVIDTTYLTTGDIKFRKYGQVVQVSIDELYFKSVPTSSGQITIATGLPKAVAYTIFSIPITAVTSVAVPTVRLGISSSGTLNLHYSGVALNVRYVGSVTYIASE